MKYIRRREDVSERVNVSLPKDFEFKVLGELVKDLERQADTFVIASVVKNQLKRDFQVAKQMIRARDEDGIVQLATQLGTQSMLSSCNCHIGESAEAFFIQYQLSAFLKKYPFRGKDTLTPAIKNFIRAEQTCRLYNLENYKALLRMDATGHRILGDCIAEMREDIEKLLDALPDIDSVEEYATHGPGTSLGPEYKHGKSTSYYKWSTLPYSVTRDAAPYAKRIICSDERWMRALENWYRSRCGNPNLPIDMKDFWSRVLTIVDGSRITTVPKNGLTDRTIAIEPLLNVFLQLGVDKVMKKRLKKLWNIDLTDQTVNQVLAELGSLCGDLATLDLKAASDTISLKICELLLPPAWYNLLLDLRSPKGVLQGKKGSFSKMSSMGNGFTFALESIIFAAIVRHVLRRLRIKDEMSVYGDDLIVPKRAVEGTIELLEYCGFAINKEKSFSTGPFRESCGKDFYAGYNVRPVFLKKQVKTVMDLYYLHNRFVELGTDLHWTWDTHGFEHTRRYIRKYIPRCFGNIYGPPGESLDTYLFSSKKLLGHGQDRFHFALQARAKEFNKSTDFYFRCLMVPLTGPFMIDPHVLVNMKYVDRDREIQKWDRKKLERGSNAFTVTRRETVRIVCTKIASYEYTSYTPPKQLTRPKVN